MKRLVVVLLVVLVAAACGGSDAASPTTVSPSTTTSVAATTMATARSTTSTSSAVPTTSAPVAVDVEWMIVRPEFGIPGDVLEVCGVIHGPSRMTVVMSDPETGATWPANVNGTVYNMGAGQWCWEGEFPSEMQDPSGAQVPIEPGEYDIDVLYEGTSLIRATVEVSSAELVAALPPSQSPADAARDGVIGAIAELPFYRRAEVRTAVEAKEGTWMLATLSRAVIEESWATGCGIGDLDGSYPIDVVCSVEYGELLLVQNERIVKAYPMPAGPPSWICLTDGHVYSGHIGDGALPDSTVVRIDRDTLAATVVVIPAPFDGGTEWLPSWLVAPDGYSERYYEAVHINAEGIGVPVESWIGEFTVDIDAIDQIIDVIASREDP